MKTFQAKRIKKQYKHKISASGTKVFPLLCPVREYDWIDGWNCRMIYSDSGVAENNCIFTTSFPRGAEEIWTVSLYDPKSFIIQFVVVNPEAYVMKLDISLQENGDGSTGVTWTNTLTGLSDDGNAFIANYNESYASAMNGLFKSLEHYLQTGKKLEVESMLAARHAALHKL
jgi:hypothetical protein